MKQPSGDIKKGIYNSCLGAAVMVAFLLLGTSDSYGQFQMGNTLIPLLGNTYPIIYANDAKGGHHQVASIGARDSISTYRRQVGMLCTVSNGITSPITYQLICADTKAARDNNTNWVVFSTGGSAGSVAWNSITANPFVITTPLQGQLLSYDGTSSSWLNINQPAIPLSGFGAATADVLLGGFKISNLADPAIAQDAATKNYVDAASVSTSTALNDSLQVMRGLVGAKLGKVTAGYGLSNINDSTVSADSATLAQYFIRRTDSMVSYVTPKNLSDSVTAMRSGLNGIKSGVDSIYTSLDTLFWSKNNHTYYTLIDTFSTNITAILSTGNTFGKYKNNSIIPSQGKSARQVITEALTEAISPAYTNPSATISSAPTSGTYEYGYTLLGTIALSSGFTPGDGGAAGTAVYYANGSALGGNSFSVPALTSTQNAYVKIPFAQGTCKNNNLGTLDCTGRITANTATSGTISFTPGYRRYFGWLSDTTGITTGAQNAAILALVDNNAWSTSQAFGTSASPVTTPNPSGTQFLVMGYVSTTTAIGSITQNGFPSIAAYNSAILSGFINNQGAVVSIRIFYSKVGQTSSSTLYTN